MEGQIRRREVHTGGAFGFLVGDSRHAGYAARREMVDLCPECAERHDQFLRVLLVTLLATALIIGLIFLVMFLTGAIK